MGHNCLLAKLEGHNSLGIVSGSQLSLGKVSGFASILWQGQWVHLLSLSKVSGFPSPPPPPHFLLSPIPSSPPSSSHFPPPTPTPMKDHPCESPWPPLLVHITAVSHRRRGLTDTAAFPDPVPHPVVQAFFHFCQTTSRKEWAAEDNSTLGSPPPPTPHPPPPKVAFCFNAACFDSSCSVLKQNEVLMISVNTVLCYLPLHALMTASNTHTHTHTWMHTVTHTPTKAYTHTHTHTYTHTHTIFYTHTQKEKEWNWKLSMLK